MYSEKKESYGIDVDKNGAVYISGNIQPASMELPIAYCLCPQPAFCMNSALTFTADTGTTGIVCADFNNDHNADIAVTNIKVTMFLYFWEMEQVHLPALLIILQI